MAIRVATRAETSWRRPLRSSTRPSESIDPEEGKSAPFFAEKGGESISGGLERTHFVRSAAKS